MWNRTMRAPLAGGALPKAKGWRCRAGMKPGGVSRSAVLLVVVLALLAGGCSKLRARQLVREANEHYKAGRYEDAIKLYQQAEAIEPQEVRIKKFIAYAYMALYQPGSRHPKDVAAADNAIAYFKRYLQVRPDDQKVAQSLVTMYMNSDRLAEAIAYFKQYSTDHPNDVQAVQSIAMLYAKQGDFDATFNWQKRYVSMLEKASFRDPKERKDKLAEAYYTLGVTCWEKSYSSSPELLPLSRRLEILNTGLSCLEKAMQFRDNYADAMAYVNLIYRQYAKYETDPVKQAAYTAKANEWLAKAVSARQAQEKQQREEQAKKNLLEAM